MKTKPRQRFKPHRDIPKYSAILFKSLGTPLLVYFTVTGNFLTFTMAYAFYYFERGINPNVTNYWDAAWWALCTISTVGYGDIVPVTVLGRIIAVFLIIVGVTFFLGFMAVLVSVMSTIIAEEQD